MSEMMAEEIWKELRAAMITLARLPMGKGAKPSSQVAWWPDFHRFMSDSYADETTRIRLVPSPGDIERMNMALSWLLWIPDVIDRKIVVMRAIGLSYPKIARILRSDFVTLAREQTRKRCWSSIYMILEKKVKKIEKSSGKSGRF